MHAPLEPMPRVSHYATCALRDLLSSRRSRSSGATAEAMTTITPKQALGLSIIAALATIAMKSVAWWLTGSVGFLSDALESSVNLAGATFALWMVSWAHAPADDEHPFGHPEEGLRHPGDQADLRVGLAGQPAMRKQGLKQRFFLLEPLSVHIGDIVRKDLSPLFLRQRSGQDRVDTSIHRRFSIVVSAFMA